MNIAILGFGTVGFGVYDILKNHEFLKVTKILDLVQNINKLNLITDKFEEIITDDIDLVIETIGGIDPAYDYIKKSLKAKKHVVTANKAVVALHLQEFLSLALENNVHFLFEASVGGGIPWIESLKKAKRVDQITSFSGIFNGTSNYILDKMSTDNLEFANVLKEAQDLGYAEADPSADIEGFDVRNKVIISSFIAFNTYIKEDFFTFGISKITKVDIAYFKENNLVVKLIGAGNCENTYEAIVCPTLFKNTDVEANITTNFNIATLETKTIGTLKFYGQGAGMYPTANAIIQDILDIYYDIVKPIQSSIAKEFKEITKYEFIIRTNQDFTHHLLKSKEVFQNNTYLKTKLIYPSELKEIINHLDQSVFIARLNKEV